MGMIGHSLGIQAAAAERRADENPLKDKTGQVMTVDGEDDNLSVGIDTNSDGTVDETVTGVTAAQFSARVGEDDGQLGLATGLDPLDPASETEEDFEGVDTSETEVDPTHGGGDTAFTAQWLKLPDEQAFLNFCNELEALADTGINPDQLDHLDVAPGGWTLYADQMNATFGRSGTFATETGTKLRELQRSLRQFADDLREVNMRYRDGKDGIWLSVTDVDEAVANISTSTSGGSSSSSSSSSDSSSSDSSSSDSSSSDSSGSDEDSGSDDSESDA